jgi:hypothetical protein
MWNARAEQIPKLTVRDQGKAHIAVRPGDVPLFQV